MRASFCDHGFPSSLETSLKGGFQDVGGGIDERFGLGHYASCMAAGEAGSGYWIGFQPPRACCQNTLAHMARARIWQIARYYATFLAYRVATPRHSFNWQNSFPTK